MNANCNVCGTTFDHSVEGIDWRDEKFLCWGCNDQGYDLSPKGDIIRHGQITDLIFGDKTLHNAKPSTLGEEFAVSPGWATFKFGCAWATIACVLIGVILWGMIAIALLGGA